MYFSSDIYAHYKPRLEVDDQCFVVSNVVYCGISTNYKLYKIELSTIYTLHLPFKEEIRCKKKFTQFLLKISFVCVLDAKLEN